MIVFDFEVFPTDWLVCFLDHNKQFNMICNDRQELVKFYKTHEKEVWVGYNSLNYDKWILDAILNDKDPYKVSNSIIVERSHPMGICNVPACHYDTMVRVGGAPIGLKMLEGQMGMDMTETPVPFGTANLTREQLEVIGGYCKQDVLATAGVLQATKGKFKTSLNLVNEFHLGYEWLSRTHAQITAKVLDAVPLHKSEYDANKVRLSSLIQLNDHYTPIYDFYKDMETSFDRSKSLIFDVAGVPHRYGSGGLHSARPNFHSSVSLDTTIKLGYLDVKSYYPSLMLKLKMLSRTVQYPTFQHIYDMRQQYVADGKEDMAYSYKILINTVFGISDDVYNPVYDPYNFNNVVVNGQLLITDLICQLENNCDRFKLIQTNTDGIIFEYDNEETVHDTCNEWGKRTFMNFKFKDLTDIWQKDVNNYLIRYTDGSTDGVGGLFKNEDLNQQLIAVQNAVKNYLLCSTPIEQSIHSETSLMNFQQIIKTPKNMDFCIALTKGDPKILDTKYNRIFYATDGYELRGGSNSQLCTSIFGTPTCSKLMNISRADGTLRVVNSAVKDVPVPKWVDLNRYIKMAKELLPLYGCEAQ